MGEHRNPVYGAYDMPYPGHWNNVSPHNSQYSHSVGPYPPGQGSPPHNSPSHARTGGIPYYNGYDDRTPTPYAPVPPTTSVTQAVHPLNQPVSPTPPHQSHTHAHYIPYAPPHSRPTLPQSQSHPPPGQPPIPPHQEQQYQQPFAQPISMSPQYPASPARPFACDMCALSFSRAHDLRRHKETHTGEKPFPCNGGCGKTFSRKDAMRRHQLVKQCGKIEEAWP